MKFDPRAFVDEKIEYIRREVGGDRAVAATSGGVDSMVTAVLGHRAIGKQLTVVFLDDGLMRKGEPEQVKKALKAQGIDLKIHRVSERFFSALKGKTDPEEKRKAFRETFYETFADVAREYGARCLLQGTIAADVVETRGGVKTQHNVLEQIGIRPMERYGYRVIEPLLDLYKPQVREVARALGLPPEIAERRPFPGPGLSVRVLGEVTPERVEIVREATSVVEEETRDVKCFQAFAVLLNDRATGITEGKRRKYGEIIVIRVVQSSDAMRADAVELPWDLLKRIERRIRDRIPSVTHVLYDLTGKPPATIEFE
ncbi:MAG: glutamine-hydrolyzing GMP synthase [Candidatus Hadarchaeales archaeon]